MAILSGDIKLVASQVMDDVDEGGGAPTSNVITDGVSNAIFPDISELDRAGGRVNLRKLHVHVQTDDRDTYMGSNIIVAEPPADPNVSITLFTTDSTFDRRSEAASAVESYLIRASFWLGFLLENHVAGQRVIQIFQRPTQAEPTIGRTLVLVYNEGLAGEVIQYVRIIRVESVVNTYIDSVSGKEYEGMVCTCEISDALRTAFLGTAPNKFFTTTPGKTYIRDTSVADAGSYCGVVPLRLAATIGDSVAMVESVYTQLVPSAATEKVELEIRPAADRELSLATTPRAVSVGVSPHSMRLKIGQENRAFSYVQILSPLPSPGTVEVSFLALGEWYKLTDDGNGTLVGTGTGTINYLTGSISVTLTSLPDPTSSLIFAWGEKLGYTNMSGLATYRQPEFSFDLTHKGIDPGSLTVTWLSGGVLKTATAAANGTLSGDATGFLSHTMGQLAIRPTAMLDAGGEFSLSYTWSTVTIETKTGLSPSVGGFVTFTTDEVPVEGSVMVEWVTDRMVSSTSGSKLAAGSSTKSSSSNTATNATQLLSSKTVHYPSTPAWLNYSSGVGVGGNTIPGAGFVGAGAANIVAVNWLPARNAVYETPRVATATVTNDTVSGSSSKLTQSSSQISDTVIAVYHSVTENGSGGFLNSMGTINYAGKTVTLKVVDPSTTANSYKNDTESAGDFSSAQTNGSSDPGQAASTYGNYVPANSGSLSGSSGGSSSSQGGSYSTTSVKEVFDNSALFVTYRTGASLSTPHTESYAPAVVQIDLAPYTKDRIVPNSIRFTWMGSVYEDVDGVLYMNPTGSSVGTTAGSVDYATGIANITDYVVNGNPSDLTLNSLWVNKGGWTTSKVFCRTPTAPVKPGGFVFSILDVSGDQIIATADNNGNITGDHCLGSIDYQTGVVDMIFGDLVLDSSLTDEDKAEWWYAKALTQITAAGKVWRPWPIDPNSLRYNVVSYFYLPLDADLLGIDPVRLPQDGRVTIFRPGGFAVVGHTGKITATVSNGQTIDCARVRLSRVRVLGFDDVAINTGYTVDLEAGTVTFDDVTGYNQPVTIEHRIEDMAVVSDVQITGQLGFTRQLTHDYPLGSYVSSALVAGDLKSRVSVLFDQATWNGTTWLDAVSGSAATGTYNDVLAPIEVTNRGAVTERWALVFTSTTGFNIVGEHVGVIGTGSINAITAPLNPATSVPYFTIPVLGWGIGWAVGNVLRFNTVGAMTPVWVVRTIQQGPNTGTEHSFTILSRGDVDRP